LVFKTVYDEQKDYLRLLIFEKQSEAAAKSKSDSDPDLLVTAGADSLVEHSRKCHRQNGQRRHLTSTTRSS
jgi:hypothetical protein